MVGDHGRSRSAESLIGSPARVKSHLDLLQVHRGLEHLVAERTSELREREQLISELERFNHTISHDLKNPGS